MRERERWRRPCFKCPLHSINSVQSNRSNSKAQSAITIHVIQHNYDWLLSNMGIRKRVTLQYADISMQFPCGIARLLSFVCCCFNPVARIIVICKTTDKWILHPPLCCNYTFVLGSSHAAVLMLCQGLGTQKNWLCVRKSLWFGSK